MDEVRRQLARAKKIYQSKKYEEAIEIYEKEYSQKPDKFTIWDKRFYSWAIYHLHIKNFESEDELIESVNLVTHLIPQADLNKEPVCAYTFSVFKAMDYYYGLKEFDLLLQWMEKIDVDLLDTKHDDYNGRTYPSRKEKYYNYMSKAYLELNDYDECIAISKKALESLDSFANSSDIWYKWRIAKSLKELAEYEEAIEYLMEVSKVKKDWFVDLEIADNYYFNSDKDNSLKYASRAALKPGFPDLKINLYPLIRDLIKDNYPDEALKHDYLVYSVKLAKDWPIDDWLSEKIEENGLDIENRNYKAIEKELKPFWNSLKYENQELKYGTITKIFEHGKSGFITSEDNESVYFNVYDIVGDKSYLREYASVSFYTEKSFDKSKNKESTKAVNIELI